VEGKKTELTNVSEYFLTLQSRLLG